MILRKTILTGLFFLFYAAVVMPSITCAKGINVLVLNSYHLGYKWSDDEFRGVMSALGDNSPDINIHLEYMDMKRYFSLEREKMLFSHLGDKYKSISMDYVVTLDDIALDFMKKYRDILFPGAGVVFAGANFMEDEDLEGLADFTGVSEKADIRETIDLILKLHPDTSRIVVINDTTVSGRKVHEIFAELIPRYKGRVDFFLLEDIAMSELLGKLRSLRGGSVIFYTFFFRDALGQTFEYDETMSMLREKSQVPVYGTWDFNMGLGMVGGKLTSGFLQGQAAGRILKRLINAGLKGGVPRLMASPNRFIFDYRELKSLGIDLEMVPGESTIMFRPVTFFQKHKTVLLLSGLCIFLLLLLVFFLEVNIYRRKVAEEKLRRSEKSYRGVFENAAEGLFKVSRSGRFLKVNRAFARMLGCHGLDEVLEYCSEKTFYQDRDEHERSLQEAEESGSVRNSETSVVDVNGRLVSVSRNLHAVRGTKGELLHFEGSLVDMTEYKKTQEMLIQTEKMMSIGGLSAGVSHEVKAPISGILQNIQVVKRRLLEDLPKNRSVAESCGTVLEAIGDYVREREITDMIDLIRDSGNRALGIIDDMLSFSRKDQSSPVPVDLKKLLDRTLDIASKGYDLKSNYDFRNIEIQKEYDDSVPYIVCQESQLQQVFFNILKNGAEAMHGAGVESPVLFISTRMEGSDMVCVSIGDNGPGMEEKTRRRIFEPFFTTKKSTEGTGLGLSVAYFIISENHGGTLMVDSEPGKGSVFHIRLPVDENQNFKDT